ncbi:hypothetical protein BKA82DRAFT_530127 [Pisolithus tinctorius]|uniref:Uncharacterized protein n=1 Tax=Pisolithus tinctorius Marx 270 TaxID=870435 RepID=A0A0C3NVT6_PISTI|nr:hypothetical protein BKA82DRAFT_530127 [Pisolithus tinctorius]KIO04975.1 hypothetical protein M404DRAFT_530127 [Pisolithus tinctorius Marx 270]
MKSSGESLLAALQLPTGLDDEELSRAISDLVSLAVTGVQSARVTLQELVDAIREYEGTEYLEPLTILPILLPCSSDHAQVLIRVCGLSSSAKEIMIVIQEGIEELQWYYHVDDGEAQEKPITAPVQRLIGLTVLCTTAIPRLKLGKRTPFQLAGPIVLDIHSLVPPAAQEATQHEGRLLLREVARLVIALQPWISASASQDDLGQMKKSLRDLLDTTVVACVSSIQASLSVREFERLFPRLIVKSALQKGWEDGQRVMTEIQDALTILGTLPEPPEPKSTSDLIYLAHAEPVVPLSLANLTQLHPLLVNSLQRNVATDETLFLLLRLLGPESSHSDATEIPPDIAESLCSVLSVLASTHLDPFMRHLNLRLLSMVLSKVHQAVRLDVLLKLTTDEELPQMRCAAVGLLKEATLSALSSPDRSTERNPFASSTLLRAFGPVLFRTSPPDFLILSHTREELERSVELLRINDCLSFYYVLLLRDRENTTGVRDPDNIVSVERSFLRPLQRFLDQWVGMQEEPLVSLLSLQVNLERVDAAVAVIKGNPKNDKNEGA